MPKVKHLFRAPKKRLPMEELPEVRVAGNSGFEGCAHARPDSPRQVLLVDSETLEAMNLSPGLIRENITASGLNVNGLEIGQKLRIGETRLEVSAVYAMRSVGESPAGAAERSGAGAECCAA